MGNSFCGFRHTPSGHDSFTLICESELPLPTGKLYPIFEIADHPDDWTFDYAAQTGRNLDKLPAFLRSCFHCLSHRRYSPHRSCFNNAPTQARAAGHPSDPETGFAEVGRTIIVTVSRPAVTIPPDHEWPEVTDFLYLNFQSDLPFACDQRRRQRSKLLIHLHLDIRRALTFL